MKFKTCIENAREELLNSFEFIKGIKINNQTHAVEMANTVMTQIDALLYYLDKPTKSKTPKLKQYKKYLPEDPTTKQMNSIWEEMNTPDSSEYKLMVLRLEPTVTRGVKINGYLQTYHLPTTIPDIIEKTGEKHGGGKYQIRIVDGSGQYVKSKTFEISGLPIIPKGQLEEHQKELNKAPSETPKS